MESKFETLQDLTGHESGVVLYADKNGDITTGIIQNWSSEKGIPRISPLGTMMSWPGEIEVVEKKQIGKKEISDLLNNLDELLNYAAESDEVFEEALAKETAATLYELKSGDKVIVFEEWA